MFSQICQQAFWQNFATESHVQSIVQNNKFSHIPGHWMCIEYEEKHQNIDKTNSFAQNVSLNELNVQSTITDE